MSVSTNITRRTAALAVLGVLLLGAGHNAQGAKSTTRKGGGGNAKGGELKAKLAANEGAAAMDRRDLQTAIAKYLVATEADPGYSDYYTQLAAAYRASGMKMEAARAYETSISMMHEARNEAGGKAYWAAVHINLGYVYAEGGGQGLYPGAMPKAAAAFEGATKLVPDMVDAYTYWGNALQEMGNMEDASEVINRAISKFVKGKSKGNLKKEANLTPEKAGLLYFHLANSRGALGDSNGALKAYQEATKMNPAFAAAYTNLGTIYQGRKQNQMAKEALATAVKLDPELAEAYTNLGIALQDLGEGEEAERMTGMAVRIKPDMAAGHNNHGRALENNNKLEAALSSYNKALKFSGQGYSDAFCAKVYLEHFLCAWDTLDQDMAQVAVNLQQNLAPQYAAAEPCVQPFRAFAYALPPTLFMNVTIKVVEQERARVPDGGKKSVLKLSGNHHQLLAAVSVGGPGRLRVAYMSSDFGGHTVGSLIRNLLKLHNRKRAEICGVGMMKGDGTEWNMEMEASSDRWLSIYGMSDQAAAFAIDALQVHILIDLNGHSKGARLGVLLRRPAPIIISYLGYPSTSGGLDQLLVSDRMSTPPETRHLYTEKLVFLPHSYFVNDHRQLYPRPFVHIATRIEHGLPEDRVIFGNFGQLYKVEPKLFDVWAQIVKRTPNGTLWALKFPKEAVKRLEQQAKSRGLTSDHMVLSPLLPIDSHLAIKALADVALDTAMFNGHTTGADTLWTGTPLVSLSGEQMRSRAGASMAYSLGVTDFLARSLQDYQALALRLAASRRRLRRARQRLERALVTSPFFDTALWAKGFERSWFLMWDALIASSSVDSKHLVTSGQNLKIDPADLEGKNLMIGTSRHKHSGTASSSRAGAGGRVHDPLGLSSSDHDD